MNWLVFGDDPDHPGAGVATVEQVRHEGGGQQDQPPREPVGRPRRCEVHVSAPVVHSVLESLGPDIGAEGSAAPVTPEQMETGETYYLECRYRDDDRVAYLDTFTYDPGSPGSGPRLDALARQVYAEVPLVYPRPRTSPPTSEPQLVGLPVWLWVDGPAWRGFDASASVAGITVTVVAEPVSAVWDMGDGTTVTCDGPGRAWSPGTDGTSDCTHTYQFVSDDRPGGRYAASVTVVWDVTWSASTGETGSLPDASRTTTFDLDVRQRQAVITYGRQVAVGASHGAGTGAGQP